MRRAGFTLVEVLVAAGIVALVALAAVAHLSSNWRQAQLNRDRVFAYARAQSILEELRAFAEVGESNEAAQLDQFDDGTSTSNTLSTLRKAPPDQAELVDPDAPVSGNVRSGAGHWRYSRRVTVRQFPGLDTRDLRIVTVRVFLNENGVPGPALANVSSVVRTVSEAQPSSQVYDVYLVAIENVPGWWVYMDTIRPFIEASLQDLAVRNPGLRFRVHWVTKLAYGRNPQYTPFFNEAASSEDPIDKVYFYPSTMPAGSSAVRYYVPGNVAARIDVDGQVRNGYDAGLNPLPYTLADQYNHALRLPEEEALFAARVAAGLEREDEPTWRLLLERMNTSPDAFRNAIVVNLHGELLPMPPLRNFSDAARLPDVRPGVRVVTHPEKLRFARGSEDVELRVYSWKTIPAAGPERLDAPIVLEIPGLDLTGNVNGTGTGSLTLRVRRVTGGIDLAPVDGARDPYGVSDAPVVMGGATHTPAFPGEMYARVRHVASAGGGAGATVVELHGSPLVCPTVGTQGLPTSRRLYGMEYIPCSTESANDFSVDLAAAGTVAKNTARWQLTIPASVLGSADRRLDVVTRIGRGDGGDSAPDSAAFATGVMYPPASRTEPENVSRTYAWWAASGEAVPVTERYQFQGDPRHCPYADLKAGGSSFPNGYNWYFDDLEEGSNNALSRWPGFDAARLKNDGNRTNDGWEGRIEVDVPRLVQVLRGALASSEALYTTLTGFSYYYIGLGNEIGYDASNGFPSSIPVSGRPFGASGTGFEQSITGSGGSFGSGVKYVRSGASGTYWWGMPWLGELYPDGLYDSAWRVPRHEYADTLPLPATLPSPKGNLPAGSGAAEFHRTPRSSITVSLPFGTALRPAERCTNAEGSTSTFNCGTSTATFHHRYLDGTFGSLSAAGDEVAQDFHFPLPGVARISRPFSLATNADGGLGDEFGFAADYPKWTARLRRTYYGHDTSGLTGSGLVELTPPGGGGSAYVLVNGIDRTTESGSAFVARYAMLTLLHGFLSAGDPTLPHPIPMLPRVTLTSPTAVTELTDPTAVTITWEAEWARWDGQPYTAGFTYPVPPSEGTLEYVLLYSTDNGRTWRNVLDDSPATPGDRPASGFLRLPDANPGAPESHTLSTPSARFPEGSYLLRVEAYRIGSRLHYSYHQEKVYLNR